MTIYAPFYIDADSDVEYDVLEIVKMGCLVIQYNRTVKIGKLITVEANGKLPQFTFTLISDKDSVLENESIDEDMELQNEDSAWGKKEAKLIIGEIEGNVNITNIGRTGGSGGKGGDGCEGSCVPSGSFNGKGGTGGSGGTGGNGGDGGKGPNLHITCPKGCEDKIKVKFEIAEGGKGGPGGIGGIGGENGDGTRAQRGADGAPGKPGKQGTIGRAWINGTEVK